MTEDKGFSLIELMIVIAIVGILAGIAWPSYQEHVRSSNRSQAMGALMGLAQAMERHFTQTGSYKGAAMGGNDTGPPEIYAAESPIDGSRKNYDLVIVSAERSSYLLQAVAKNSQLGDGNIQLSSSGAKAWDRDNNGAFSDPAEMCWSRSCN